MRGIIYLTSKGDRAEGDHQEQVGDEGLNTLALQNISQVFL